MACEIVSNPWKCRFTPPLDIRVFDSQAVREIAILSQKTHYTYGSAMSLYTALNC